MGRPRCLRGAASAGSEKPHAIRADDDGTTGIFPLSDGAAALPIQPALLGLAATIMVWTAFLRAEWSDRLLFSAGMILSSTVILGGGEVFFYAIFRQWYGSSMVCAGVITYIVCLLNAHRVRNRTLAVLSLLAVVYALALPYYSMSDSILDIIGGVLFAGTVFCASFFIAERAGVKPFATTD